MIVSLFVSDTIVIGNKQNKVDLVVDFSTKCVIMNTIRN